MTACVCGRVAAPQIAAARRALAFLSLLNLPLLSTASHAFVLAGPPRTLGRLRVGADAATPAAALTDPPPCDIFDPSYPSLRPSVRLSSSLFSRLLPLIIRLPEGENKQTNKSKRCPCQDTRGAIYEAAATTLRLFKNTPSPQREAFLRRHESTS